MLEDLFAGFMADVAAMPAEHRDAAIVLEAGSGTAGRARAVADYIAGMTDRYALPRAPRLARAVPSARNAPHAGINDSPA